MCSHDDYDVSECEKRLDFDVLEDLTGDLEKFPSIGSDCTEECKKKMIQIIKLTMKKYTDMAIGYFKDAKLDIDPDDGCDIIGYISYCENKGVGSGRGFVEMVEKAMNLKIVDGKVIHLTPDDNL